MDTEFPFKLPAPEDRPRVLALLKQWSKSAKAIDLTGHQLFFTNSFSDTHDWTFDTPVDKPGIHRRDPPSGLFTQDQLNPIYLVIPLRVGRNWASQVWAASFDPGSDDDHADFAIKIFQSSWHPCIKQLKKAIGDEALWDKFQEFEREAAAYQAYTALQGSAVPYIRGFYRVILPHNEPAVAIVMERIRKRRISSTDMTLSAVGQGLLDIAYALFNCGWITKDLLTDNVLWPIDPKTGALGRHPVFIDFSRVWEKPTVQNVHTYVLNCIYLLRHYGFDIQEVEAWVRKHTGPESDLITRFGLSEGALADLIERGVEPGRKRQSELPVEMANA